MHLSTSPVECSYCTLKY